MAEFCCVRPVRKRSEVDRVEEETREDNGSEEFVDGEGQEEKGCLHRLLRVET